MAAEIKVTSVKRNPKTRAVYEVELLIENRFVITFQQHPSKPRTLINSAVVDPLLGEQMVHPIFVIPTNVWNKALRRAYAIFFSTSRG